MSSRGKFIDRRISSRLSRLSAITSTPKLPRIASPSRQIHTNSFSISIRKHLADSQYSSSSPNKIEYYTNNEINHPSSLRYSSSTPSPEQYTSVSHSLLASNQPRTSLLWIADYANMQEKTRQQQYINRVTENMKNYGNGFLRRSHNNALFFKQKQRDLIELHYRLKKQREENITKRQEKAAAQRFRKLLQKYQSS